MTIEGLGHSATGEANATGNQAHHRTLQKALMLETFKQPSVRDLAWVISSPAMLQAHTTRRPIFSSQDCWDAFSQALAKLQQLEEDPTPLLTHLDQLPSHRVGRYFEALTYYWLKHLADVEVVTNNLQLRDGKQTLGEIDFLFRENNQLIHWEVAVKYYLQLIPGCEEHEYIGPNTADNLASKMERLFDEQLLRSTEKNLTRALGNLDGTGSIKRQAFIKGWLFYHGYPETSGSSPSLLNPNHLKGFWIHHGEDELPSDTQDTLWTLLEKPHWLATKLSATTDDLITRDQLELLLKSHFNTKESPLLMAQLEPCESGYLERLRGFAVSPQWPN